MRFFKDERETLWPLSRVARIETHRSMEDGRQVTSHIAHFEDEASVILAAGEFETIRQIGSPHMTAGNGYFVVHVDLASSANDPTHLTPVLSWIVDPDQGVVPVTIDGVNDDASETLPVLCPDGAVRIFQDSDFASLDEYVEHIMKSQKR